MMLLPVTQDWARCLLAYESVQGKISEPREPALLRVYEKLRRTVCALAGVTGFQSLAVRALTLARTESPCLKAVQVTPDGHLQGLGEAQPQLAQQQADDGGAVLIAQLLGLLLTLIGEALTLRLMQDVWPDIAFDEGDSGNGGKHENTR
jgi:hypothetical protein